MASSTLYAKKTTNYRKKCEFNAEVIDRKTGHVKDPRSALPLGASVILVNPKDGNKGGYVVCGPDPEDPLHENPKVRQVRIRPVGGRYKHKKFEFNAEVVNYKKGSYQVKDTRSRQRRMAQRQFSRRRDSPVMVRLLEEIVAAQDD